LISIYISLLTQNRDLRPSEVFDKMNAELKQKATYKQRTNSP
jgi:hypothetical protein